MWWLRQLVRVEWRIGIACAGFLVGVYVASFFGAPVYIGVGAALASIILFLFGRLYATALLLFSSFIVGLGYGSAVFSYNYTAYKPLLGKAIEFTGRVKEDVVTDAKGRRSLQLGSIQVRGSPLGGSVYTSLRSSEEILRSDEVVIRGVAEQGFGNFSLSIKNAQVVEVRRAETDDVGRTVRDWFARHVRMLIPEPAASLGVGYLTGQKSALPEDLSESLKIAGLTHIVVASGYNLTILVRLARRLLLPVSKFTAAMAAVGMVVAFMAVTGLSPSMTRAGIVSGLSILFWYYGRKVHPLVLLLFVAAVTAVYRPGYLWGDLGWQLSFSAFFGVMVIGPLMHRYFYGDARTNVLQQTLTETIAAHIATVPIIAMQFGVMSHVAIVANLLVVPLVPLAMLLTFICGLWAIIGVGWSSLVSFPTARLLDYMVGVAQYVAEIEWAQSQLEVPGFIWAIYAVVVIAGCLWMKYAAGYDMRTSDVVGVLSGADQDEPAALSRSR